MSMKYLVLFCSSVAVLALSACHDIVRSPDFDESRITHDMRACTADEQCVVAEIELGCGGSTPGYRAAVNVTHLDDVPEYPGYANFGYRPDKSCDEWTRPACRWQLCELVLATEESCVGDDRCAAPRYQAP
jgi:hypothetical protein